MAVKYVRSTSTGGAANGSSWTDAYLTIAAALAAMSAGDTAYVSQAHAESQASTISWTGPGTAAAPCRVLCVNDGATPPTAMATGATASTTTNNNLLIPGGYTYFYGIELKPGTGTSGLSFLIGSTGPCGLTFDTCKFTMIETGGIAMAIGNSSGGGVTATKITFINHTFTFASTGDWIGLRGGKFIFQGGSLAGSVPTSLFIPLGTQIASDVQITGMDLSLLGSGKSLVTASATWCGKVEIRNCKLGASVATITGTISSPGSTEVYMDNADSANSASDNYRMEHYKYQGKILANTATYLTAGASDGTTSISHQMVSLTTGPTLFSPLEGPWINAWQDTTGGAKTVTVEFLHDKNNNGAADLNTDQIYLEVEALATANYPRSTYYSSRVADVFATPASTGAGVGSGSWTISPGMTTADSQHLQVTLTPNMKGPIRARVCLVKANYTVFVDPVLTIA